MRLVVIINTAIAQPPPCPIRGDTLFFFRVCADPGETDIVAPELSFVGGRRSVRVLSGGRRSALQLGGGRRLALRLGCGRHSALRLGCGRRSAPPLGCGPGGPGNLITVNGTMKKEQYIKILNNNIRQSAEKLGLGHQWTFQHDNDPKHTAKVVKKWLADKNINVLQWPSQSPDLNPIENLWRELKIRVMARRPSNLKELELIAKDEWAKIPVGTCKKLNQISGVDSYADKNQKLFKARMWPVNLQFHLLKMEFLVQSPDNPSEHLWDEQELIPFHQVSLL
ncbi:hypothetical protein QTP70_006165 [Hemibagrus guttatus]|uniref:Tc1-like transposase DDE domain-containing protein n=1 Tax=Hemibagrus guttatus TaxID=175788 RepID=A0AAE0V9B9_9TELE|nr:hypothetical protein QTP70_006165 [Hemibagrus guttatus]